MTDVSPWSYLLLAVVGFVSSIVNIVAAGGSFLTLPVLILLGAPTVEANGTNRLGVIAQNASGVWGFHRHRVLDERVQPLALQIGERRNEIEVPVSAGHRQPLSTRRRCRKRTAAAQASR